MTNCDVMILLSGGIDSTACVNFLKQRGAAVIGLFVDYGQAARDLEERHAHKIAEHYGVRLMIARVDTGRRFRSGEVLGRNQLLISTALLAGSRTPVIAMGIHRGTGYYDCSSRFARLEQTLVREMTRGRTELLFPFLEFRKGEIIAYCLDEDVPLEKTYSCENGRKGPCRTCSSCLDRAHAKLCVPA